MADPSLFLILLIVAAACAAVGWRGAAVFIIVACLLHAANTTIGAVVSAVLADEEARTAFTGGLLGVLIGGALVWRVIYNMLVRADYRRDIEAAKAKRDKRLI